MRKRSLPALALIAALATGGGCGGDSLPDDREAFNLILISLDTCRADRLSCYGAERPTPNLDAFAAEAVRFDNCLAQSCITAPSHLSMLTGQYVHRHGLLNNGEVSVPAVTLASTLQARGWQTAAFTGHGQFLARYGHGVGFDTFESWIGPEPTEWPFWRRIGEVLPSAYTWLDEHGDEPFFLVLHGYDPHQPYWPRKPWRKKYAGWYEGKLDPRYLKAPDYNQLHDKGLFGPEERRYVNDLYDGEIGATDEVLGGVFDELRRRGLLDRSIVVFTSDHGEELGTHDRVGHGQMNEPVLHVPLLIRFPGATYAGVRDDPVQTIDLAPTLLTALGVAVPEGMQGENLLPLIRGERAGLPPERMRIAQVKDNFTVRFDDRWKLFGRLGKEGIERQELFDLQSDPGELRDLYPTVEGRAVYDRLLDRFLAWRADTSAADERHSGTRGEGSDDDRAMLEALGYVGDKE